MNVVDENGRYTAGRRRAGHGRALMGEDLTERRNVTASAAGPARDH
jgi:hypothetical protein